ncbi:hypothetical protein AB0F88_26095 [Streptosporangium sp. NPDC023963]|uniref:hypothetical protein n=1 Tax=Streptosporangium sp. NPDC023963 TaxID=3155608 RepID=UPI00343FD364
MRRIAAEAGTGTMPLHRHVPSRDDLIALMTERLMGQAGVTGPPSGDRHADPTRYADGLRAMRLRHPADHHRAPVTPRLRPQPAAPDRTRAGSRSPSPAPARRRATRECPQERCPRTCPLLPERSSGRRAGGRCRRRH